MEFGPVFNAARRILREKSECLMESDDIAGMLGVAHISKYEVEKGFADFSDTGPIHCRFIDIMDMYSWRLRFWVAGH